MRKLLFTSGCIALALAGRLAVGYQAAGDAAKGKEVFQQCSGCHATTTDEEIVGPSLKGLFKREKLKNGQPVNEANVRAMINMGGGSMPAFDSLTDEEKNNLIAYLKTL